MQYKTIIDSIPTLQSNSFSNRDDYVKLEKVSKTPTGGLNFMTEGSKTLTPFKISEEGVRAAP